MEADQYIGLAGHVVFLHTGLHHGPDFDDLRQDAMLAIIKALPKYNPDRGEAKDFIAVVARNAIIDRGRHRARCPVGELDKYSDPQFRGHELPNSWEAVEAWSAINRLGTEREIDLAKLIFRDGLTYRQAGSTFGLSKPRVCCMIGNLFNKVRLEANRSTGFNVVTNSPTLAEAIT